MKSDQRVKLNKLCTKSLKGSDLSTLVPVFTSFSNQTHHGNWYKLKGQVRNGLYTSQTTIDKLTYNARTNQSIRKTEMQKKEKELKEEQNRTVTERMKAMAEIDREVEMEVLQDLMEMKKKTMDKMCAIKPPAC